MTMFICITILERIEHMSDVENILKENTLPSLVRAIQLADGIEFDIRSTIEGGLILHHDKKLAVSDELRRDLPIYVEKNTLSDLVDFGFPSFEDIINNKKISNGLIEQGKIMNIELKLPHPSSGIGAGWLNSKKNISYISKLLQQCGEILNDAEIPKHSVIFYGFFKHMNLAANKIDFNWNVSSLFPNQLRFGSRILNRIFASKEFSLRSFKSMLKLQRTRKSPILPCGLEYFISPFNRFRFDKKYGLKGKSLERLLKLRNGFPIYIWPGLLEYEFRLYNAGISILTDDLNPTQTTLPEGVARWTRPSTQPLNDDWKKQFLTTDPKNHFDLIRDATQNVSPWHELNDLERNNFIKSWRKKWNWRKNLNFDQNKLPWDAVRVIGHRGCGSTSRPIFY